MYYNNSVGVKAQKDHKNEKSRDDAVTIWVIVCMILISYILTPLLQQLLNMLGPFLGLVLLFLVLPIATTIMTIYSTVLYWRANRNVKDKNELRASSRALLTMALIMFVFNIILWAETLLIDTSGKGILAAVMLPISLASVVGFLAFLIAAIRLKKRVKKS